MEEFDILDRNEFLKIYKNTIIKHLQSAEIEREALAKQLLFRRIGFIFILLFLLVVIAISYFCCEVGVLQTVVSAMSACLCMVLIYNADSICQTSAEKKFKEYIKVSILSKLLSSYSCISRFPVVNFIPNMKKVPMSPYSKDFAGKEPNLNDSNLTMKKDWYSNSEYPETDIEKVLSGLFSKSSFRIIDDLYKGSYKGVDFVISDETLREEGFGFMNSFQGAIAIFHINKNITNRTIISKNRLKFFSSANFMPVFLTFIFPSILILILAIWVLLSSNTPENFMEKNYALKAIANMITLFILCISTIFISVKNFLVRKKGLDNMHLEDLKFDNMYASYSTDQVEGRYAITPAFMERLLKLKLAFHATNISASFYQDKLLLAIETKKDLFEIGDLWHPLTDRTAILYFYEELRSIIRMIEYFKLDEKTGL